MGLFVALGAISTAMYVFASVAGAAVLFARRGLHV
jgi:hypothetical protein